MNGRSSLVVSEASLHPIGSPDQLGNNAVVLGLPVEEDSGRRCTALGSLARHCVCLLTPATV
ncbi:hypothetical protein LEMLEM_LOCUS5335 [Lemmus lemmus]